MSFIINPYVYAISDLAKILVMTDSTNSYGPNRRVLADGSYLYSLFSNNYYNYLIKYDSDLSISAYQYYEYAGATDEKLVFYDLCKISDTRLMLCGRVNTSTPFSSALNQNITHCVQISDLSYINTTKVVPKTNDFQELYCCWADSSYNFGAMGRNSSSTANNNYVRYNSSFLLQKQQNQKLNDGSDRFLIAEGADVSGSSKYVTGEYQDGSGNYNGFLAYGSTTSDTYTAVYGYAPPSDQLRLYYPHVDTDVYVAGYWDQATDQIVAMSAGSNLSSLNWAKAYNYNGLAATGRGCYHSGNYLYVVARTAGSGGETHALILKINDSDGTISQALLIAENTNDFVYGQGIYCDGTSLFVNAISRVNDGSRNDMTVIKIENLDFSKLDGVSTAGGEFTFLEVSSSINVADIGGTYTSRTMTLNTTSNTEDPTTTDWDGVGTITSALYEN